MFARAGMNISTRTTIRYIYAGWRCYFIVIFTIRNHRYGLRRKWESISVHEVQNAEAVEWASNRNLSSIRSSSFLQNICTKFVSCRRPFLVQNQMTNIFQSTWSIHQNQFSMNSILFCQAWHCIREWGWNRWFGNERVVGYVVNECDDVGIGDCCHTKQTWKPSPAIDSTSVTSFCEYDVRSAVNDTWLPFYCLLSVQTTMECQQDVRCAQGSGLA